ncbi:hypothetical protein T261_08608 [Streptomyces lydicus]|nr:hypothetical protein T261_08608 [Streptomyces lydicus]
MAAGERCDVAVPYGQYVAGHARAVRVLVHRLRVVSPVGPSGGLPGAEGSGDR